MEHHCHCLHRYHRLIFFPSRSGTAISVIFRRHTTILINHTGIIVIMHHRDIIIGPIPITPVIININPIMDINTIVARKFIQGIITIEIINIKTAIVQVITGTAARFNITPGTWD